MGAFFTILPFFQPWIESAIKSKIHLKGLWAIGGACLVLSFYQAWLEQYNRVQTVTNDFNQLHRQKAALDAAAIEKNEHIKDLERENTELRSKSPQVNVQVPPSQVQIVRVPDVAQTLLLTSAQAVIISNRLRQFSTQEVEVFSSNSTIETARFARPLETALKGAGLLTKLPFGIVLSGVPHVSQWTLASTEKA